MFRCSTACDDETFLASRAASAPGLFTIGVRGLTPPGSPRIQLELDIIQAVGRVIRKAAGKPLGTIVIPVFIDESEDADHVLSQSAFEPVWQVHKALRAHDDWKQLDGLWTSRRRTIQWKSNARICLSPSPRGVTCLPFWIE